VEVSEPRMVAHLQAKVLEQQRYARPYRARYRGTHTPDLITDLYRDVFGTAMSALSSFEPTVLPGLRSLMAPRVPPPRSGLASVGVDALVERLNVDAYLTGDQAADTVLRRVVQRSDLGTMWPIALREALVSARSFLLIWPDAQGEALISVESPEQVAVHRQQGPPYQVDAGLKVWADEWTSARRALLWTDTGERVELLEQEQERYIGGVWSRWAEVGRVTSTSMPPLVEVADRQELTREPRSDIARIESLVDGHDVGLGLLLLGMRFGAIPIRTITGLPVPRDENGNPVLGPDGKPVLQFDHRSDKVWVSTETDTEFDTLAPADLSVLVGGIDALKREVRAVTALPAWSVGGDLAGGWTGETVKASEAPLVRRARTMMRGFGDGQRRAAEFILEIEQVTGVDPLSIRVQWADPETRVEAQAVDAAQKLASMQGPLIPLLLRRIGWPEADVLEAVRLIEQPAPGLAAQVAQVLQDNPDLLTAA
jgi:hypothetical protein